MRRRHAPSQSGLQDVDLEQAWRSHRATWSSTCFEHSRSNDCGTNRSNRERHESWPLCVKRVVPVWNWTYIAKDTPRLTTSGSDSIGVIRTAPYRERQARAPTDTPQHADDQQTLRQQANQRSARNLPNWDMFGIILASYALAPRARALISVIYHV